MKFKVTFKEAYMPHEVTRICDVQSERGSQADLRT